MTKPTKKIRSTSKDNGLYPCVIIVDDLNDNYPMHPEAIKFYSKWIDEVLFPQKQSLNDD
ncbi:hypothetical protein [Dysgonomonas sp.]